MIALPWPENICGFFVGLTYRMFKEPVRNEWCLRRVLYPCSVSTGLVLSPVFYIDIYTVYYNEVLSGLSLLLQLVRFQTHTADVVTGRNGYTSPGFGAGKCWEGVFIPRWWSCVSMMLKYYNYYLLFSTSKTDVQETGSGSPSKYTFKSYMIVSQNLDKTWWNNGMKENKKMCS